MSFSRWQKLMAARMLKAVRPAAPALLTAGAGADSFTQGLPEDVRPCRAQGANVPESGAKAHLP